MRWLSELQQRLGWKLFLSHLVIVVVGVLVLAGTAELHAPTALSRHISQMRSAIGNDPALVANLHDTFHAAINEVLVVAAAAALVAAVITTTFVTRRIVGPVREMMRASRRIAAGDYHERVHVPGKDELGALARTFNWYVICGCASISTSKFWDTQPALNHHEPTNLAGNVPHRQ